MLLVLTAVKARDQENAGQEAADVALIGAARPKVRPEQGALLPKQERQPPRPGVQRNPREGFHAAERCDHVGLLVPPRTSCQCEPIHSLCFTFWKWGHWRVIESGITGSN